jgi:hypothetical protein
MISAINGKTVTFKQTELSDITLLISHLQRNPGLLLKDFRLLPHDYVDAVGFLLGSNGDNRLLIIEIAQRFDDGLLYRSLNHIHWTRKNIFLWIGGSGQMNIDPSLVPGIIYIVPQCPTEFTETFEFIAQDIPITVIKYLYLESEAEQGFFFEPIALTRHTSARANRTLTEEQITYFKEQAGLTHEEIMAFLE